jgi:hypothetical protein
MDQDGLFRRYQARLTTVNRLSAREMQSPLVCRFSDAGMQRLTAHTDGRRPKGAKARNRGRWCGGGTAGAMGI